MKKLWILLGAMIVVVVVAGILLMGKEPAWPLEGRAETADSCIVGCACIFGDSPSHSRMLTAEQLIEHFDLKPLPVEGGYFKQTYRANETIPTEALPARYRSDKVFGTAIYFLLTSDPESFSAMHILPSEEIYHFYLGDPVEMLLLYPDSRSERVVLGQDILNRQHVQFVVPRGVWQGSRLIPGGRCALLGTTMAPGFGHQDYVGGERDELIRRYPDRAEFIKELTRPGSPLHMDEGTEN